jgi:hypothetical protein
MRRFSAGLLIGAYQYNTIRLKQGYFKFYQILAWQANQIGIKNL